MWRKKKKTWTLSLVNDRCSSSEEICRAFWELLRFAIPRWQKTYFETSLFFIHAVKASVFQNILDHNVVKLCFDFGNFMTQ